jgi:thiamine-phosphate pyrophosphorylase
MLCLVTDRRRLAGRDATLQQAHDCLVRQVLFALEAGVDLIQVRERDLEASKLAAVVRAIVEVTAGTATRVVVNDRLDIALACGADGVHLRSDSMPVHAARRIAPRGFLVGRSVHSTDDAVLAAEADYLIAGTVFRTSSKPDVTTLLGVSGLRAIAERVRIPILAIGGIRNEADVEAIARAGAAGCAAIGLFVDELSSAASSCRAVSRVEAVRRLRARFDSVRVAS